MSRFVSLPDQWKPIALGREVGRQPLSIIVDDVPVVVFRGASAGRSRQIVVPRRNSRRGNPMLGLADRLNARVLYEDQANVEGLWPREVPPPGQEIPVPSDAPTLAFQHYYHHTFGPLRDTEAAK